MNLDQTAEQISPEYVAQDNRPISSAQKRFYCSQLCDDAREQLQALVDNPKYDTDSEYFESNSLGFVDRHLYRLSISPHVDVIGYISNLKIMTNARRS
jgi:hypothetical protein